MVDITNGVPVYLPDLTLSGRAEISKDRKSVTLTFTKDIIPELVIENLIGFGVVFLSNDARDQVSAEADKIVKENTDDK